MANKITLTANDGSIVEFYDEIKAQGGVKDVYFSPDKTYVVAFYRKPINANDRERITNIVGIYRQRIFDTPEGNYWKNLFAWPTKMVEWNGKTGIIMPFYDKKFFFSSGPFKGKEKAVFVAATLFVAIVMIARITDGHHYLSDVTVGFGISFFVQSAVVLAAYGKKLDKQVFDTQNKLERLLDAVF